MLSQPVLPRPTCILFRAAFEEEQLRNARERLQTVNALAETEETTISRLNEQKDAAEAEIVEAEAVITTLKEELSGITDVLDEKTKALDAVKKTTSRASKGVDLTLKDIASLVCIFILLYQFDYVLKWCFFSERQYWKTGTRKIYDIP